MFLYGNEGCREITLFFLFFHLFVPTTYKDIRYFEQKINKGELV